MAGYLTIPGQVYRKKGGPGIRAVKGSELDSQLFRGVLKGEMRGQDVSDIFVQAHQIFKLKMQSDFLLKLKIKLTPQIHSSSTVERMFKIISILERETIDLQALAVEAKHGFPFEMNQLRRWCWLLSLKILPAERSQWPSAFTEHNQIYGRYIEQFIPDRPEQPIRLSIKDPNWPQHKQNFILWEQIEKDTTRTHSQKTFFNNPSEGVAIPYLTNARKEKIKMMYCQDDEDYRLFLGDLPRQRKNYVFDHLSRMLYIWGCLNPRVKYIQGLNQIIAPIFYLFNHQRDKSLKIVEAEVMLIFNVMVSNIMDILIKELDDSQEGMHGRALKLEKMLALINPGLVTHLNSLMATPSLYAIRWLTMLFAQDLQIFDILTLWDSLIFSPNFNDFLDYLCLSVLVNRQDRLLMADFGTAMELLKNVEEIGVQRMVRTAESLRCSFEEAFEKAGDVKHQKEKGGGDKRKGFWNMF